MPKQTVATWDIEKFMKRLEALRKGTASMRLTADVEEAEFRAGLESRLFNGEHIHLRAVQVEECINPHGKCWEGPRNVSTT